MPSVSAGPLEEARQHLYQGILILYDTKESIHGIDSTIVADLLDMYNQLNEAHIALSEREAKKKTRLFAIFQAKGRDILEHWEDCKEFNIRVQSASASAKARETEDLVSSPPPLSMEQGESESVTSSGSRGYTRQPIYDFDSLKFALPNNSTATVSSVDSFAPLMRRGSDTSDSGGSDDGSSPRAVVIPFTGRRESGDEIVYCQVSNPATMSYDSLADVLRNR
ncbi:hypothetical protein OE88DRAFT_1806429 [Heliocybe sulcata]|uniref:Uncharacterized protein n=1 Tax=Heliocybe sulcata TaxID=5364 RepID=A0A5C3N856_9AGAM|nr:hypothetical protein OE88DRAFT_1806429 [Heliocybe sulcata]